ncbi:hypothetical protein MU698_30685, partial [Pseudomonas aeruginosa]
QEGEEQQGDEEGQLEEVTEEGEPEEFKPIGETPADINEASQQLEEHEAGFNDMVTKTDCPMSPTKSWLRLATVRRSLMRTFAVKRLWST